MQTFGTDGNTFHGHLSTPVTGKGSGVLLLHAWWGLNHFMIQTCDRLAQQGAQPAINGNKDRQAFEGKEYTL